MSFTKRKVLVVAITKDIIEPECYESMLNQDYPDYTVMVHIAKPKKYFTSDDVKNESFVNRYINCPENRNYARAMALASDADYFLFVDSDTVIPKNTISKLMLSKKDAIGGYYSMHGDVKRYVAGGFVKNEAGKDVFLHCLEPLKGVRSVAMIGLGCALISRKLLTEVDFEDGLDLSIPTPGPKPDEPMMTAMGECMAFGHRATLKGFELFMDGDIICTHLTREGHYSTLKGK